MIKQLKTILAIALCAVIFGSCTHSQRTVCEKISQAFKENKPELASELCNHLYEHLSECSVETLGELTMDYYNLSVINSTRSNEAATYSAMERMVNCYESAMKKNPTAAKALWTKIADDSMNRGLTLDIPVIADSFRTQLTLRTMLGEDLADAEI
ncbi:MAG: hypothetical protein K2M11_00640 [Paramuribaculum sp.]|nr:hypothetical protein [Paramuribaculum sp.]